MTRATVGQAVTFVDAHRNERSAIVTHVFKGNETLADGTNLVIVSDDPSREDSCGRQIERVTSVPHQSNSASPGYYWK